MTVENATEIKRAFRSAVRRAKREFYKEKLNSASRGKDVFVMAK